MSILQSSIVPASAGGGYEIANSLRFNDNDSAYLSRTPASAGNRKTWTWSGWVKRTTLSNQQFVFLGSNTTGHGTGLLFRDDDTIQILDYVSGYNINLITSAKYRDVGAWYHIVLIFDTTQATSSDRVKLYINGDEVTSFGTSTYPVQNNDYNVNTTSAHYLKCGTWNGSINDYSDGYLADVHFIDGQALTPDNFGETGDYGEWKPIKYTGTYGTNGFYLDFENSGSLGADTSGNGNNWTPTNLTANDQMLDSPTNNFCTLNPLNPNGSPSYSEGNLKVAVYDYGMFGTQSMLSGKWYWENLPNNTAQMFGIVHEDSLDNTLKNTASGGLSTYGGINKGRAYYGNGDKKDASTDSAYGATFTTGDIIGVAYDADAGSITFYKNGVSQGVAFSSLPSGEWLPLTHSFSASPHYTNFGQDSSFAGNKTAQGNSDANGIGDFYYTPPTGYLALCTQNLPDATVIPSEHFNTVLWAGNSTDNRSITGVGFPPDWTWIKSRTTADNHSVYDSSRGAQKLLISNATTQEQDDSSGLKVFDSDGFTVGLAGRVNTTGRNYVAWNWKMAGTGVSNTDGSITSTVSANTAAGQSIVSYTGNGTSGATIGHGLGVPIELAIFKSRTGTSKGWPVFHSGVCTDGRKLRLDATSALDSGTSEWPTVANTSTTFRLGTSTWINENTKDFIAYCFHSVDGYSKVGSYTGNGSTDGTFVYTGFRPAYVIRKRTDSNGGWQIHDISRDIHNETGNSLKASDSAGEATADHEIDILSNGFKMRTTQIGSNASGGTYIYIAIAEQPFKNTNAR